MFLNDLAIQVLLQFRLQDNVSGIWIIRGNFLRQAIGLFSDGHLVNMSRLQLKVIIICHDVVEISI